jgi:transposase
MVSVDDGWATLGKP